MRRNRTARILVWPTLTATAVIAVLLSRSTLQERCATWTGLEWLGPVLEGPHPGIAGGRGASNPAAASTRRHFWPEPLEESRLGQRLGGRESWRSAASPSDRPLPAPSEGIAAAGGLPTETWLDTPRLTTPQARSMGARLQAPVRDEREELAGFDATTLAPGSDFGPSFSAASVSTRRTTQLPQFAPSQSSSSEAARSGDSAPSGTALLSANGSPAAATASLALPLGLSPQLGSSHGLESSFALGLPRVSPDPGAPLAPRARGAENRSRGATPGAAWPATPALNELLIEIAAEPEAAGWSSRIRRTLAALQSLPSLTDPRSGELLAELQSLAEVGLAVGEQQTADRDYQERLLRTSHALHRRVVVWQAVWRVGAGSGAAGPEHPRLGGLDVHAVSARRLRSAPLENLIAEVRRHASTTGDAQGWERYLLLDQIGRLATEANAEQRRLVAQRLLSRLQWDALEPPQAEWLEDASVQRLASRLRPWADAPIDYADLLAQLERQESDAIDLGSIQVATAVQTLRFAGEERAADVAEAINSYYRNANVRFAVSAELLERLLPAVPSRTTSIAQTIQGAPVRGSGQIESALGIELVPSADAWQLRLGTDGTIRSRTATERGPVEVRNQTHAAFAAATPIRVDRRGVQVGETSVDVESRTRLGGLRTDYDGFPLIESLVRGIAMYQYEQAVGPAKRESEALMRAEIERTLAAEVEQQIATSSQQLSDRLLGPLARLQLAPLVVDLETSESRLSARYRVAGDWQLAGFTPRPRAMSDSLLSLQVHQSALNNTFERLTPSAAPQPIRELTANLLAMFGAPGAEVPEDMPHDVQIQFAPTRPITVEIEDDRLWLTLRIVRLTRTGGIDLSHFIVRAAYRAEADGMQARLVRDGGLQVSGPRMGMRERLPVRAIFNVVLSEERPLPLVGSELAAHPAAAGLEVRTLELTDGWLALAIGPEGVRSTEY
ncbi:hypothetical protein [Candidatus Laterigemmans baculatus]|uniref:hypothetical protein n=1 Tax=Candidatus Laterigemmans baculatus TaxID=2770505 RepID=UPI0013DAACC3|nr:hypothetical protein [Candidatus Laterigemmans baculatus]